MLSPISPTEFNELAKVTGGVHITGTGATALRFPVLATLGRLEVANNPALTQISGLVATSINGDVTLRTNPALATIGTMSSLTQIGGSLIVDDNDALVDLTNLIPTGMNRISGALTISNNARLSGLGKLSSMPRFKSAASSRSRAFAASWPTTVSSVHLGSAPPAALATPQRHFLPPVSPSRRRRHVFR